MKRPLLSKLLVLLFLFGILFPLLVVLESCGSTGYKTRNGGKRISSSGSVGNQKHKNRHVWGK